MTKGHESVIEAAHRVSSLCTTTMEELNLIRSTLVWVHQEQYRLFWKLDTAEEEQLRATVYAKREDLSTEEKTIAQQHLEAVKDYIERISRKEAEKEKDIEVLFGAWPEKHRFSVDYYARRQIRYYSRRHKPYYLRRMLR